jgi:hypothetical protein
VNTESAKATTKFARITFASTPLGQVLVRMRERFQVDPAPDTLVVPYVITCAAYLEAKLNDSLFHHTLSKFGEEVAGAFVSLSLPKKLLIVVPVLTEGKYSINKRHFVYERLASLIRVRNSIAHAKAEFQELTPEDAELAGVPMIFLTEAQRERRLRNIPVTDFTMGATKAFSPLEYHEALEKFEKWFFQRCPDRLSKVAMVIHEEHGHWQPDSAQMVKFLR